MRLQERLRTLLRTGVALLVAGLAAAALAMPAAAQRVSFSGGDSGRTAICGQSKKVVVVDPGEPLTLRTGPRRGGRTLVRLDRCGDGRWKSVRRIRSNRRSGVLVRKNLARNGKAQDLRARIAGGRPAYARVGVGEIVDIPFTVQVVNQNRTSIPCLGAPDGQPYPVHGSLVAPRSALDSSHPAATLYVHGLGYSSFFFHFEDVPGYDYAEQQARAGHASIVIDRLGNPAHDDLPDGNATCIPAQADMADQVIGALPRRRLPPRRREVRPVRARPAGRALARGLYHPDHAVPSFESADAHRGHLLQRPPVAPCTHHLLRCQPGPASEPRSARTVTAVPRTTPRSAAPTPTSPPGTSTTSTPRWSGSC